MHLNRVIHDGIGGYALSFKSLYMRISYGGTKNRESGQSKTIWTVRSGNDCEIYESKF